MASTRFSWCREVLSAGSNHNRGTLNGFLAAFRVLLLWWPLQGDLQSLFVWLFSSQNPSMNRYLIVYQCSIKRMLSTDITDRFSLGRCRRPQGSAHCCCTDTRNSCTTKELFSADGVFCRCGFFSEMNLQLFWICMLSPRDIWYPYLHGYNQMQNRHKKCCTGCQTSREGCRHIMPSWLSHVVVVSLYLPVYLMRSVVPL